MQINVTGNGRTIFSEVPTPTNHPNLSADSQKMPGDYGVLVEDPAGATVEIQAKAPESSEWVPVRDASYTDAGLDIFRIVRGFSYAINVTGYTADFDVYI